MTQPPGRLESLSMFFPFHNEEENIVSVLEEAIEVGLGVTDSLEIIAVNDGSTDRTLERAESVRVRYPEMVRIISFENNRGYGAAVKSGLESSTNAWIFFSDGDRQFRLSDISKLIELTGSGSEKLLAIGYRINREDSFIRRLNAALFNAAMRMILGISGVRDIDCAFKLIPGEAIQAIPPLTSEGAMISAELLARCSRAGFTSRETGVQHYPRLFGKQSGARLSVIFKAFIEMFACLRSIRSE
ncbi:MAG: glycosyltransferase family 2 protein [Candidatus Fermentibacteria bacterium]